jgi:hypothetical protein
MVWHGKQHQPGSKGKPAPKRRSNVAKKRSPKDEEIELEIKTEETIEQSIVTDDFPIIEGQYSCDMCGLLYTDKDQLKEHIPIHF